ncbi:MAG TPA: cytochrome c oxidase assembly protein [Steroidobacteraceae bacterium]|jgi:putative membrane protein
MPAQLPYCGTPPAPAALLYRFNLDPILIAVLILAAMAHLYYLRRQGGASTALAGWAITGVALISPLCALSVSLFSARVGQHMILILFAAPLLALRTPPVAVRWARHKVWISMLGFMVALWFWHMPAPYDATFDSTLIYWAMHVTLFGSAVALWRMLLRSPRQVSGDVLLAGVLTSMQMGFLGAILTTASRPLYFRHLATAQLWGLTPLQDQALGGILMWVPGIVLFLWAGLYALGRLRSLVEHGTAA